MNEKQTKISSHEITQKLLMLIKEIGYGNINKSAVAKELGTTDKRVARHLEKIKKNYEIKDLNGVNIRIFPSIEKALDTAHRIIKTSNNEQTILHACRTVATITENYAKMLESFGYKTKVPDRIETTQIGVTLEELERLKNKLTLEELK